MDDRIDAYFDEYHDALEPEEPERPRDRRIDEAKEVLLADLFGAQPERVFYERQIQVFSERRFFHWITGRALGELAAEGRIGTALVPLMGPINVRFYWSTRLRYWKRSAEAVRQLVARYSRPEFTRALGQHGETMFDAALPTGGFMPKAKNVREYEGRKWGQTAHDLDRVFERDGVRYGVEVKNTLPYIDRRELQIKLAMCEALGLLPLFIMRSAPKSYIHEVNQAGASSYGSTGSCIPLGTRPSRRRYTSGSGFQSTVPGQSRQELCRDSSTGTSGNRAPNSCEFRRQFTRAGPQTRVR